MKKRILAFMLVFSMCFGVCLTTLATVEINEHLTYVLSTTVPNTTNNLFKSGTIVESEMKDAEFVSEDLENKLNARNIALVAYKKRREAVDSNNLRPVYLRKSSAERLKSEK